MKSHLSGRGLFWSRFEGIWYFTGGRHAGGGSLKWLLAHISEGEEMAEEESSVHFVFQFHLRPPPPPPVGGTTHIWGRLPPQLILLEQAFGASLPP